MHQIFGAIRAPSNRQIFQKIAPRRKTPYREISKRPRSFTFVSDTSRRCKLCIGSTKRKRRSLLLVCFLSNDSFFIFRAVRAFLASIVDEDAKQRISTCSVRSFIEYYNNVPKQRRGSADFLNDSIDFVPHASTFTSTIVLLYFQTRSSISQAPRFLKRRKQYLHLETKGNGRNRYGSRGTLSISVRKNFKFNIRQQMSLPADLV